MKDLTLLYAEDDVETLEGTAFLLKRHFSEIYTAKDGQEALELYEEKNPDVILLDINMPKLSGMQVAKKIRQTNEETPILFLTAHSETERLLDAIDLGTFSYIIKPFRIEELTKPIIKIIDKLNGLEKIKEFAFEYSWDDEKSELFYKNMPVSITKNEILLVKLLLKHENNFISAQEIASEFYDKTDKEFEINNIVQLISRFRKKVLKECNTEDFFIENIYGSGYKIK